MSDALKKHRSETGLTLLEIAVVVLILGIIISTGLPIFQQVDKGRRYDETDRKMEKIIDALGVYAANNFAVPCPADPAPDISPDWDLTPGTDDDHPFGSSIPGCGIEYPPEGIVPFRDLGLRKEDVIDGWGNYITYRVSPAFTNNVNIIPGWRDQFGVSVTPANAWRVFESHEACRTDRDAGAPVDQMVADWIENGMNVRPGKAVFCCPFTDHSPGTPPNVSFGPGNLNNLLAGNAPGGADIVVVDDDLRPQVGQQDSDTANPPDFQYWTRANPADPAGAVFNYDPLDIAQAVNYSNKDIEAIAFVLISHGANGTGAFLANGTRDRRDVRADGEAMDDDIGCCERENLDSNMGAGVANFYDTSSTNPNCTAPFAPELGTLSSQVFCTRVFSEDKGIFHFDDVVKWRTQEQILGEFGGMTCFTPY